MPDDLTKRRPMDAERININQAYEVEKWCHKFKCTPQELKDAVKKAGPMAKDVEKELPHR